MDRDERLNWPSVTLHIPASELGVMGETGGGRGAVDVMRARKGATKFHPNFPTSEVGIMDGNREGTPRADGLGEVGVEGVKAAG